MPILQQLVTILKVMKALWYPTKRQISVDKIGL
jgi:hypothetical protein